MVAELRAERDAAPSPEEVESLREDATEARELAARTRPARSGGGRARGERAGDAELERLRAELEALRAR